MGEYQLQKASAPADGRTDGRTDGERKPHIFWSLALSIQMTIHYPWPQMVDVCVHVHVYVYIYIYVNSSRPHTWSLYRERGITR